MLGAPRVGHEDPDGVWGGLVCLGRGGLRGEGVVRPSERHLGHREARGEPRGLPTGAHGRALNAARPAALGGHGARVGVPVGGPHRRMQGRPLQEVVRHEHLMEVRVGAPVRRRVLLRVLLRVVLRAPRGGGAAAALLSAGGGRGPRRADGGHAAVAH